MNDGSGSKPPVTMRRSRITGTQSKVPSGSRSETSRTALFRKLTSVPAACVYRSDVARVAWL
jgi:hypothetical protein